MLKITPHSHRNQFIVEVLSMEHALFKKQIHNYYMCSIYVQIENVTMYMYNPRAPIYMYSSIHCFQCPLVPVVLVPQHVLRMHLLVCIIHQQHIKPAPKLARERVTTEIQTWWPISYMERGFRAACVYRVRSCSSLAAYTPLSRQKSSQKL